MANPKVNPADFKVLVVDDEESIRSMLGEAIGSWNFQIATAPSGEAALEFIKAGNIPHIVLTDIRMGAMSGLELSEHIKNFSSEIEIIIMTSHGTYDTAVQAMRIGVFDYLSKPFETIDLVRATLMNVAGRVFDRFHREYLYERLERQKQEIETLSAFTMDLSAPIKTEAEKELEGQLRFLVIKRGLAGLAAGFGTDSPVAFFQYVPGQSFLVISLRVPQNLFGNTKLAWPLPANLVGKHELVVSFLKGISANSEFLMFLNQAFSATGDPNSQIPNSASQISQWQVAPLMWQGSPRGVIAMLPQLWREDPSESPSLFKRYMYSLSAAFEVALANDQVRETAIRDGLTGLYNVRHFKEEVGKELAKSARHHRALSLIFFDVDHFKKYNDTNGHPAGDLVLKMMAQLMKKGFRTSDILARYGGEEFIVALPDTTLIDALVKAEHLRKIIEETAFPNEQTQPLGKVTASIGVSEFPTHGTKLDTIIKVADDALYEGKKKSRNIVIQGKAPEGYISPFESKASRPATPPVNIHASARKS